GLFSIPHRAGIGKLARVHRPPTFFLSRQYANKGGLMPSGADSPVMYRRAADYVARVLRGTRPADLPVEQASKFELVINLKVAKAIGIEFPTGILVRADEVIE